MNGTPRIMAKIKLPHLEVWKDRHGHVRHYFRRRHGKRIPLPDPKDAAFPAAYEAAKAGIGQDGKKSAGDRSLRALVASYFESTEYTGLRASTKGKYQGQCQWLVERYGALPFPKMRRVDVIKILDRKARTGPAARNNLLKVLRVLVRRALDLEWIAQDPTVRIKKLAEGTYHTWDEAQIAAYEARWQAGTRERLAFALTIYSGQRRADVAAMTWGDIDRREWTMRVTQEKTGRKLTIPVHKALREILEREEARPGAIIAISTGKRLTTESFGNFMADAIDAAGLPDECVLHGLRKAAARRLAEAGCSANVIASITGHETLSEVERYTKEAEQPKLAKIGIRRMK